MIQFVVNLKTYGRQACSIANHLKQVFPNKIELYTSIPMYNTTNSAVFLTQTPAFYKKQNIESILNGIHFLRPSYLHYGVKHTATNGFSVYKSNNYKHFIPMLYCDRNISTNTSWDVPFIGIYNTSYRNTKKEFIEYLQSIDKPFNLLVMGYNLGKIVNSKCLSQSFTQDKEHFFNTISHFLYIRSKTFVDPWPTTLEEAVIYNKQIIIPNQTRSFIDGIDDICSCIQYHSVINLSTVLSNQDSILKHIDVHSYYMKLLDNNFTYDVGMNMYDSFEQYLLDVMKC